MLEITSPNTGERLKVADNDFEYEMTWDQAKDACKNLGDGWRLPDESELKVIFNSLHKNGLGNFDKFSDYWSHDEDGYIYDYARSISFYDGEDNSRPKENEMKVRAVRTL
jgi:hypothetical protein